MLLDRRRYIEWALAACALTTACASAGGTIRRPAPTPAPLAALEAAEIEWTLFLVGDAGEPRKETGGEPEPVLRALRTLAGRTPDRATVVFLGDNIYPAGMPDSSDGDRPRTERVIDEQLDSALAPGVRRVFVPGNHDWNDRGRRGGDGLQRVRAQARYVAARAERLGIAAAVSPRAGCPGPGVLDVGARVRVIAVDTEWWLQSPEARRAAAGECVAAGEPADSAASVAALRSALDEAGDRHVVVVAHHPLMTGGSHGGYCPSALSKCGLKTLWARLRPGPAASRQDVPHPENERMRRTLRAALAPRPPLLFAAGHDHNLQVLRGGPDDAAGGAARHYAVSGAGIYGHGSAVACLPQSLFASPAAGFLRLDVLRDGRVALGVVTVDARDAEPTERLRVWLAGGSAPPPTC